MKRKRIVVMGFMGACPIAGVIWQHVHYIVGLQRLGHDVYYIEDSARIPYNAEPSTRTTTSLTPRKSWPALASEFDFEGSLGFLRALSARTSRPPVCRLTKIRQLYRRGRRHPQRLRHAGIQRRPAARAIASSMSRAIRAWSRSRSIKVIQSTIDYLRRHHALFHFRRKRRDEEFPVPLHELKWLPTRQPVVTDLWKTIAAPPPAAVFTSVANWSTSGLKDIEWRGEKYLWSKSREFLRFVAAPKKAGEPFELATDIKDEKTREILAKRLAFSPPHELSVDYWHYRDYIRRSKGEFTVAKDQYVRLNTGWFSDRSACYLAAGRPVITQETGFTKIYGQQGGLFAFRKLR